MSELNKLIPSPILIAVRPTSFILDSMLENVDPTDYAQLSNNDHDSEPYTHLETLVELGHLS